MTRTWRVALVASLAAIGLGAAAVVLARNGLDGESIFFNVSGLVFIAVSAVLVIRVPENRVSWALLAAASGFVLTGLGTILPSALGDFVIGIALFLITLPSLGVLVPLWFPTGAPPTPKWRWVAWLAAIGVALFVAGGLLAVFVEGVDFAATVACTSPGTCLQIGSVTVVLVGVLLAVASLILRWVRSRGVERLQLRWLLPSFTLFGIGAVAEFGGFQYSIVATVLFPLGAMLIPVSVGIAITRYRLYEIDRIVSRTVSYSALVIVLAGAFFGSVTLLTTLVSPDSDLVTAAATLLVAGLFTPVRRKLQSWVDRRFNRSRYDAERVMDGFASTLQDRIDGDAVISGWAAVVSATMQPTSISVWVR
jgi:hypothetical protein